MTRLAVDIPKIGLVMETVRIARWLKTKGDTVKQGEPLLEVETEKSVVEIEAPATGRLDQILASVGQEAKVGDRVAWLDSDEAPATAAVRREPPRRESAAARTPPPEKEVQSGARTRSSPAARRLSADRGLDVRKIAGSGPGGRVQLRDVTAMAPTAGASSLRAGLAVPGMSAMQRALARAMTLSNATVPQFTVEQAMDCSMLQKLRTTQDAAAPGASGRLSVNDFLLQAVARTLVDIPALNAIYTGSEEQNDASLTPAMGTHVGLVVALDGGLLVPVLRDVERLPLQEVARRRRDCIKRALAGRLKQDEITGATFSISNLGARGPDRFTAMINPPESAILAVGRQRDCVVAHNGGFAVRPMSVLTLTVDHRVANGRVAAEFLAHVIELLESGDWKL